MGVHPVRAFEVTGGLAISNLSESHRVNTRNNLLNLHKTDISETMDDSVQRILSQLTSRGSFDAKFLRVLQALNAGRGTGQESVELF